MALVQLTVSRKFMVPEFADLPEATKIYLENASRGTRKGDIIQVARPAAGPPYEDVVLNVEPIGGNNEHQSGAQGSGRARETDRAAEDIYAHAC